MKIINKRLIRFLLLAVIEREKYEACGQAIRPPSKMGPHISFIFSFDNRQKESVPGSIEFLKDKKEIESDRNQQITFDRISFFLSRNQSISRDSSSINLAAKKKMFVWASLKITINGPHLANIFLPPGLDPPFHKERKRRKRSVKD